MGKTSSWISKISFLLLALIKQATFLFMFYKKSDYVAKTLDFLSIFDWGFCSLQKFTVDDDNHKVIAFDFLFYNF